MTVSPLIDNPMYQWLDRRLHLTSLLDLARKKQVPAHKHSIWYYMGGIILMLLLVQLVTGILLMIYYIPEIASAHASILTINTNVNFGWFIRSLHSWGANLAIVFVFLHMFSAFFMRSYRYPREITWVTGFILLVVMMAFGFTGYLLPWDEVSFFATKIGLDITEKTPLLGPYIADMLRGGDTISQATLSRFFVIHIFVLPLALAGLMGVHLMMVQLQGMSAPKVFTEQPEEKKRYIPFFPDFLLKDVMVWVIAFNVLAALTVFMPWGLGIEADPFAAAPDGIKPEWYFLAMFQFLKLLPAHIGPMEGEIFGMGFFALLAGILFAIPFIDTGRSERIARLTQYFGIGIVIGFVVFTIWGAL